MRLTVTKFVGKDKYGHFTYECICDCGNKKNVQKGHLTRNKIKSCGCYRREVTPDRTKHGGARKNKNTSEYNAWIAIRKRCYNKNHKYYSSYGGRGIEMCKRWKDDFSEFISDMGNKPINNRSISIDRIDNNKGYYPENCRWATQKIQSNNRRSNRHITYNGETHTITEWSIKTNISTAVLSYRIKLNLPLNMVFEIGKKQKTKYKYI